MGHSHSHQSGAKSSTKENSANRTSNVSRATVSQIPAVGRLAQILLEKTSVEENVNGITATTFQKYVFPKYKDISDHLFHYFVKNSETDKQDILSYDEFVNEVEKFLGVLPDSVQTEIYLKMYGENSHLNPDGFRDLLLDTCTLAIDYYSEGPRTCQYLERTINTVIEAAFHRKPSVPVSYLVGWIQENCPRLFICVHRYIVHVLTTSYRHVGVQDTTFTELELSTPVLEREQSFSSNEEIVLLPLSQVWLLALTLPEVYIRPSEHQSPARTTNGLTSQNSVAKMLGSICPSHWTPLYISSQHGLGANRFLHHVTAYRGPTLTVLRGDQNVEFCMATTSEWRESHQYWGSPNSIILQLTPLFQVLERGEKTLYCNQSVRGYPKGVRAGSDPRRPVLKIDENFSTISYREAPYRLLDIEVWGCGSEREREAQIERKRWEVKDVEKTRQIKIKAEDWADHPDRYLLELGGGRPMYSEHKNDPVS